MHLARLMNLSSHIACNGEAAVSVRECRPSNHYFTTTHAVLYHITRPQSLQHTASLSPKNNNQYMSSLRHFNTNKPAGALRSATLSCGNVGGLPIPGCQLRIGTPSPPSQPQTPS